MLEQCLTVLLWLLFLGGLFVLTSVIVCKCKSEDFDGW